MSLAGKIGKNTVIKYIQTAANIFLGALSGYLAVKYLTVSEFGFFTLAISSVWAVLPWIDLGLSQVVTADVAAYLGANDVSGAKRLLIDFGKIRFVLGTAAAAIIFAASFFLVEKYGVGPAILIRIAAGVLFLNNIKSVLIVIFESHTRFLYSAVLGITELTVKLAAVVFFVVLSGWRAEGVIAAYLVSAFAGVAVSLPLAARLLWPIRRVVASAEPIFKKMVLGHGKYQALGQPLKSLGENFQIWFIGWFSGSAAIGLYRLAMQIYNYLSLFFGASEGVMVPVFSEEIAKDTNRANFLIQKIAKYLFWLSIAIFLFAYTAVPVVLRFLLGNKYDSALPLFFVMMLSLPVVALNTVLRPTFFAFKDQKSLFKVHLINVAVIYPVAVLLAWLFGPGNGAMSFTVAIVLAAFLSFSLRVFFLKKIIPNFSFSLKEFFIFDEYDKNLLARILHLLRGKFLKKI